jgi:hypothetical protein
VLGEILEETNICVTRSKSASFKVAELFKLPTTVVGIKQEDLVTSLNVLLFLSLSLISSLFPFSFLLSPFSFLPLFSIFVAYLLLEM